MFKSNSNIKHSLCLALLALGLNASSAWANHPVLVEGELDFDGDGRVGLAEDNDDPDDRVFGTLNAALAAANGGVNQNGRITIVTSGRFGEQIVITGTNGNVTIEAAPGVEANIDAVIAGTRAAQFPGSSNIARQDVPGIVVDAASNRRITLRNLVIRNWSEGITVMNNSHVAIDNCRIENNRDYGIHITDRARVAISDSDVNATGFRVSPGVNNVANPGNGIEFEGSSSGLVCKTTITGSFRVGLKNGTSSSGAVKQKTIVFLTIILTPNSRPTPMVATPIDKQLQNVLTNAALTRNGPRGFFLQK